MSSESTDAGTGPNSSQTPTWTYPTRFCRICREDVAPTVTMYPPGVPPRFQKPIVEYRNEDEYGRLIKPCKCTGSMRYIHELCLLRSRTENSRKDSMWKCHTCGYKFNFQKLAVQRFLSSRFSSGALTVGVMVVIIFLLGFIADPIINLYVDPYETLLGDQTVWDEVRMKAPGTNIISAWAQHFMKGLISMGLVGFLKTILLNPLNWLNLRHNLGMTSARTTTTGRDRAINISWIAVLIGVVSAFYFFYQWVQTMIQMSLKRVGNNIVDTQLPGDDDDLKPPPGWTPNNEHTTTATSPDGDRVHGDANPADASFTKAAHFRRLSLPKESPDSPPDMDWQEITRDHAVEANGRDDPSPILIPQQPSDSADIGRSTALDTAHDQSWSFASI